MRFSAFALVVIFALIALVHASDECKMGGEYRRTHHCAAVRHTMKNKCCWMTRDGNHGLLPIGCCGTGWKDHDCEAIIDQVCETHPDDLVL
jgi:hypothetical protein